LDSYFPSDFYLKTPGLSLQDSLHPALVKMGLKGPNTYISTSNGCFYPVEAIPSSIRPLILVSTTLHWAFGFLGFACYSVSGETELLYVPGVFVGTTDSGVPHACPECEKEG